MSTSIVTIAKNEEFYIPEWVEYHLNLGVDHIFLYNNSDDSSKLRYSNPNLSVINIPNVKSPQLSIYNSELVRLNDVFDWIIFIDLDEFINLNGKSIGKFLEGYSDVPEVLLKWRIYGDNDILDVVNGDYSVVNRFTNPSCDSVVFKSMRNCRFKTYSKIEFTNPHGINNLGSIKVDINDANINHYITKSVGEYIKFKMNRGSVLRNPGDAKYESLSYFFKYNTATKEKYEYANNLINSLRL